MTYAIEYTLWRGIKHIATEARQVNNMLIPRAWVFDVGGTKVRGDLCHVIGTQDGLIMAVYESEV